MSGIAIVTELLLADPWFQELASADRLKEDRLPENAALPAIVLSTVSSVDRQTLERGAFVRSAERVSVTVRAASVRDRKAVIARVRAACSDKRGTIAECFRVSVKTAGQGPSVTGPGGSFEQTQDFRVGFDAPA